MPCFKCKKKGIPIPCKYCNLSFCSRCIQLEIHNCSGSDIKKQDSLEKLKCQLKFEKEKKFGMV
jgi:hypothetical protein